MKGKLKMEIPDKNVSPLLELLERMEKKGVDSPVGLVLAYYFWYVYE